MKISADAQALLNATPYRFSDDCEPSSEISDLLQMQGELRSRLQAVGKRLTDMGLYSEVTGQTRTREVYETNAIEFVGPSFQRTYEILKSDLNEKAVDAVREGLLLTTLTSESEVLSVIGVHGAKEFAKTLWETADGRPLVETDIRSIHELICSGEDHAGSYRGDDVTISLAAHKPPHALVVSKEMHDLVDWLNEPTDELPATLSAAIAHAWLTHIHPFQDGNGRVARVLVNMLTMRAGLPPVILRHSGDRGAYLDALSHSDEGGDVLPFAFVLLDAMKRTMKEIEKPQFLREVFRAEIQSRGHSLFDHWSTTMDKFVEDLVYHLSLYRLHVERVGYIDRASFELLKDADAGGNSWFLRITDSVGREIIVWFGFSSLNAARGIPGSGRLPSLRLSIRDHIDRVRPYRKIDRRKIEGLDEVVVVPDVTPRVLMTFEHLNQFTLPEGAERFAGIIAGAFSRDVVPPYRPRS